MFRSLIMLGMVMLVSACAVGNKYDYNAVAPQLETKTTKAIAVAVSDQRPYVLSGDKDPDFVGLQRAGFGNPWPVHTSSGGPLAGDLGKAIATSLTNQGANATAMTVTPGTGSDSVQFNGDRLLFVAMKEWKTDVFAQVTLHWDLEASVLDPGGNLLASKVDKGVTPVGGAQLESGNALVATANASRKLQALLNSPEIKQALEQ